MKILLVALALVVAVRPVVADDKIRKAAAHYRQGVAFEKAAAYDQAIAEYKAAHALDNRATHLLNIGRVYDLKNDPKSAIEFYEKFLAAEPEGPNSKQAREAVATATKKVTEEEDRKKKEEEAKRRDEELARQKAEVERKRIAAEAHLKQATAFAQARAWDNAAEEYRKATVADGDPAHLIDAAEAYRQAKDLAKARTAYQDYLDQVPLGARSDEVRAKVADLTREIDAIAQAERDKLAKQPPPIVDAPKKKKSRFSPTWLIVGGALVVTGVVADLVPASGENGKLDATDFAAPALYGLGAAAVIRGVF